MALVSNKTETIFLSVKGGKLAQKSDAENGTKFEYVDQKTNETKTSYYDLFSALEGVLKGIKFDDSSQYGEQIRVFSEDQESGEQYVISMDSDNGFAIDLMRRLPNVQKGQVLTFRPVESESKNLDKEGKPYTNRYFSLKDMEEETKIESFYNENNSLPEWKETKVNRKTVWDKSDFLEALRNGVQHLIISE
jgi:hypothetical protein